MTSATGMRGRRKLQPIEIYSRKYYTSKIKAGVMAEIAARGLGQKDTLRLIKERTLEAFENETDDVKAEIQNEFEAMSAEKLESSDQGEAIALTPLQRQT